MSDQELSRQYIKSKKTQLAEKISYCQFGGILLTICITAIPLFFKLREYDAATADINSILIQQREVSLVQTSKLKGAAIKTLLQQNMNEL